MIITCDYYVQADVVNWGEVIKEDEVFAISGGWLAPADIVKANDAKGVAVTPA